VLSAGRLSRRGERSVAAVDCEDFPTCRLVGFLDGDVAVQPAGPRERAVDEVRPVRGGDDDHALELHEAVEFGQQLGDHPVADAPALARHDADLVEGYSLERYNAWGRESGQVSFGSRFRGP